MMTGIKKETDLTSIGMENMLTQNGIIFKIEVVNNSASILATKDDRTAYAGMATEIELCLNKECSVYKDFKNEYIRSRAVRFLYHKLLENSSLRVRR